METNIGNKNQCSKENTSGLPVADITAAHLMCLRGLCSFIFVCCHSGTYMLVLACFHQVKAVRADQKKRKKDQQQEKTQQSTLKYKDVYYSR